MSSRLSRAPFKPRRRRLSVKTTSSSLWRRPTSPGSNRKSPGPGEPEGRAQKCRGYGHRLGRCPDQCHHWRRSSWYDRHGGRRTAWQHRRIGDISHLLQPYWAQQDWLGFQLHPGDVSLDDSRPSDTFKESEANQNWPAPPKTCLHVTRWLGMTYYKGCKIAYKRGLFLSS